MQTKLQSLLESIVNVIVGYLIAVYALRWALSLIDVNLPLAKSHFIGGIMTVVSIVRSYLLRRLFNRWIRRDHAIEKEVI